MALDYQSMFRTACTKAIAWMLCAGLGIVFFSGCMFMRLDQDMKRLQAESFDGRLASLRGKVFFDDQAGYPCVVLLFDHEGPQTTIKDYMVINHSGFYYFLVSAGEYTLVAFEDRNRNMVHDPGEPCGMYGDAQPVKVDKPGSLRELDITLGPCDIDGAEGLLVGIDLSEATGRNYTSGIGVVVDPDAKYFSQAYADKGLWEPYSFLKEVGYGLLFLEPYDPKRIPVLFVYGVAGNLQHWRPIMDQLDHTRFQPWFFNYPTGLPLEVSAGALDTCVKWLQDRYRFPHMFVVAHSMGGLVARRFVVKNIYDDQRDVIALFLSISTPWGGHELAAKGVENAPAVVPSWRDMVPGSDFSQAVFKEPLPDTTPFYLFFGYGGRSSLQSANNDGAVTLRSQLDYRAQENAARLEGFDEGHVAILSSPEMIRALNKVLAVRAEELEASQGWGWFSEEPSSEPGRPIPAASWRRRQH